MVKNNIFINWCKENNLFVTENQEVFFLNERTHFKPRYIINNKIYVDIIRGIDHTKEHDVNCKVFSKSFGHIMILFREILPELHLINKFDIEKNFNFKF